MRKSMLLSATLFLLVPLAAACGDDGENPADLAGIGWSCTVDTDCPAQVCDDDATPCPQLRCLTQFTGGYCGLADCTNHEGCPAGGACVAHDDGTNYCFRTCVDKPECNTHRGAAEEANCSGSITWVPDREGKACVPPSSGI